MSWTGRHALRMTALTLATYGDRCHLCLKRGATTADHLIPRSRGGDDSIENLRPAHARCNEQRGNRSVIWWRRKYAPHLLATLASVDNTASFSAQGPGNPRAASSALPPSKQKNELRTPKIGPEIGPETLAFFADRSAS